MFAVQEVDVDCSSFGCRRANIHVKRGRHELHELPPSPLGDRQSGSSDLHKFAQNPSLILCYDNLSISKGDVYSIEWLVFPKDWVFKRTKLSRIDEGPVSNERAKLGHIVDTRRS